MTAGLRPIFSRRPLVCAAVIAVVELGVVFTRTSWIGLLGYTPEWSNAGLFFAAPLIAGASAFLARAHLSEEVAAITGARARWGATRVIVAAWCRALGTGFAAHGLVMLVALAVSVAFGASGSVTWEPFAYAAMSIALACALGIALGATLPYLWSTPLAIVVTYAVWYIAATSGAALPVDVGGATISLAGLGYSAGTLMVLLLATVVTTVVFLSLAAASLRWQEFAKALMVFSASVLCVIAGATVVGVRTDLARFESQHDVDYTCAGSAPKVCLAVSHATRLDEIARRIDDAAGPLRAVGVDLSGVVLNEESADSRPGTDGVLLLPFGQLNGIGARDSDYARSLLRPANCAEYFASEMTPELDQLLTGAQLIGDWFDAPATGTRPLLRDDQVRELYEGLRTCSVTEVSLGSAKVR